VGIGTDTFPLDMLAEMRLAALLSRTADEHVHSTTTADVFAAATVGGGEALGREDIGRVAVGAKADLVLVDLEHPAMHPLRDPLRSLVHTAGARAVRDVYVDGRLVVEAGRVLTLDLERAGRELDVIQARAFERVPALDWAHRGIDEVAPPSLPLLGG
jgi:cytosine/adenosine deaminase-related metal-dependent hydrolase